ncbi:helix-turn-helix domain-containing protein [Pseudalkalibacillus berkeleyi]|uniref:Helix-turn-helix domain-containing protein n=1 Tax=Pseudalkalibacillus berkeleyi TaxID=1069813 RepID=A0ABS9H4G7_9BACL|nr:helix-turn-helix domain-containing protein [Pseudalkalibacillus berkeleyi]MCF6138971.1 helix-turn-helix domain-containing protein [Pseudalkalibacillus berkeleyi]
MRSLDELVRNAQRNDSQAMEQLLKRLDPKIKHSIHSIEKKYQEDVEQEVKLKIMEAVQTYELKRVPSLADMLQKSKEGRSILQNLKNDNSEKLS